MTAPSFSTQMTVLGQGGLDLLDAVDRIPSNLLARMVNVTRTQQGEITTRVGLTSLISNIAVGSRHHSVRRLNDPAASTFSRVWGIGSGLFFGATSPTLIDGGYSGDPLHLVPYRPPLSGDTWMFVADRSRMRKVRRSDGLDLPIGIPAPTVATGISLASEQRTTVDEFNSTSGWVSNVGTGGAGAAPSVTAIGGAAGGTAVRFNSDHAPTTVKGSYYNFWSKAVTANLSQAGSVDASDDDLMHLWVRIDDPADIVEVKVYVNVSANFSTSVLPGTSPTQNEDAYVKAFVASDFTALVAQQSPTRRVGDRERARDQVSRALQRGDFGDDRESWEERRAARESSRVDTLDTIAGKAQWSEFGVLGVPLRRGDFLRIGSDDGRDWTNVTGIVILVQTVDATDVAFALDEFYLTGGRGPDTSEPGNIQYDYRSIHYDPRTGAKSNPSPVMVDGAFIDSSRRRITISPPGSSDGAHLQRIYRRGGTLTDNWYLVGTNTGNGASFNDDLSDAAILAAGTVEIDNDQPVSTVSASGDTVRAQPVPVLWGPDQDVLLACGDPLRPGHVYWSKPGEPDHWPPNNNVEVCSPSEELMSGLTYGGQSFAFSRERLYALYVNLGGVAVVTPTPTACKHGLISRWGLTTGLGRIFFVSRDGIYETTGGPERNLTDELLRPLFHGEARHGLQPIDFSVETAIRLTIHDNELWFLYQDTAGNRQVLIYSLIFGYVRYYDFNTSSRSIVSAYSEEGDELRLILGSRNLGASYTHEGLSDDGNAIASQIRTGASDQDAIRQLKRYGDLVVEADRAGTTLTVTPLVDSEATTLTAEAITTGTGRTRYNLDVFGSTPRLARNVSIDVAWTVPTTATVAPKIFQVGSSYIVQPDDIDNRITEWDSVSGMTDKYIKGLLLDVDTFGLPRTVEVQRDGGVIVTSFTVKTTNREIVQKAFPQFQARLLRFRATDDQGSWIVYGHRWVFDEEPLSLERWETQELDHGVAGWQSPIEAYITLRATHSVKLDLRVYDQVGASVIFTYWITNTGGAKRKVYVPFRAVKGVAFKYVFSASGPDSDLVPFWLYREESHVVIQPWGAEAPIVVHPFGNDALDLVRGMYDAEGVAAMPGGGSLTRGRG